MSTDIERAASTRVPANTPRAGQATMVEQSRAQAEVHAAILVAQQSPRNKDVALAEMREVCAIPALAERAFFSFRRGGKDVTGATVHLARELARIWGNLQYSVNELTRDDEHGQSEMQAVAWDVQTNTRVAATFIVPHARDTKQGRRPLVELRDVYENNANAGARRVREAIYQVLPRWFVDEAEDLCRATLRTGNGRPLDERIAGAVRGFDDLGVTVDQLERKRDRPRARWTEDDVAQLGIIYKSIQRGEVRVDDVFPPVRVTKADIVDEPQPERDEPPLRADDPDLTAHLEGEV